MSCFDFTIYKILKDNFISKLSGCLMKVAR